MQSIKKGRQIAELQRQHKKAKSIEDINKKPATSEKRTARQ